jgi:Ca2+-binding EF-hand superfamily protein
MKLAALAFLTTLGLAGIAAADPAGPISPPAPPPAGPVAARADRPRGPLRQMLLERFDRNRDGRLDPEERRHAIRALRRLARRMEIQDRRGARLDDPRAGREARMRELVRRYDRNGDGVVSPDEMPPGLARRLQRLDRNGDGWLDERDRP